MYTHALCKQIDEANERKNQNEAINVSFLMIHDKDNGKESVNIAMRNVACLIIDAHRLPSRVRLHVYPYPFQWIFKLPKIFPQYFLYLSGFEFTQQMNKLYTSHNECLFSFPHFPRHVAIQFYVIDSQLLKIIIPSMRVRLENCV